MNCRGQKFASLVFRLLPALGLLVSPPATVHTLASKVRIICLRNSYRFNVIFLAFAFHSFLTLCFGTFHLPDVQRRCAAEGRHRFSVSVSTPARRHAWFGKSQDLPKARLSGDHGGLLARVPSRLPPAPLAGSLHLRQLCTAQRLLSQDASMSPKSRPSLYIFSSPSTKYENTSQMRCCDVHLCPHTLPWALTTLQVQKVEDPKNPKKELCLHTLRETRRELFCLALLVVKSMDMMGLPSRSNGVSVT